MESNYFLPQKVNQFINKIVNFIRKKNTVSYSLHPMQFSKGIKNNEKIQIKNGCRSEINE